MRILEESFPPSSQRTRGSETGLPPLSAMNRNENERRTEENKLEKWTKDTARDN